MDTLKQIFVDGWPVIAQAPVPVILLIVAAFVVGWVIHSKVNEGQVNGLNAQLAARDERLTLATESLEKAKEEQILLEKKLQEHQRQIDEGASRFALTDSSSAAATHLHVLDSLLNQMETSLVPTGGNMALLTPRQNKEKKKSPRQK